MKRLNKQTPKKSNVRRVAGDGTGWLHGGGSRELQAFKVSGKTETQDSAAKLAEAPGTARGGQQLLQVLLAPNSAFPVHHLPLHHAPRRPLRPTSGVWGSILQGGCWRVWWACSGPGGVLWPVAVADLTATCCPRLFGCWFESRRG